MSDGRGLGMWMSWKDGKLRQARTLTKEWMTWYPHASQLLSKGAKRPSPGTGHLCIISLVLSVGHWGLGLSYSMCFQISYLVCSDLVLVALLLFCSTHCVYTLWFWVLWSSPLVSNTTFPSWSVTQSWSLSTLSAPLHVLGYSQKPLATPEWGWSLSQWGLAGFWLQHVIMHVMRQISYGVCKPPSTAKLQSYLQLTFTMSAS